MNRCIRIDPDGTVTALTGTPLNEATFDYSTVATCTAPFLDGTWVLVLDDFGAQDQPRNRKAWGLYGRSPIFGTAFVGRDDHGPIPDDVLDIVRGDIDTWPIPEFAKLRLTDTPDRPDMLTERPES